MGVLRVFVNKCGHDTRFAYDAVSDDDRDLIIFGDERCNDSCHETEGDRVVDFEDVEQGCKELMDALVGAMTLAQEVLDHYSRLLPEAKASLEKKVSECLSRYCETHDPRTSLIPSQEMILDLFSLKNAEQDVSNRTEEYIQWRFSCRVIRDLPVHAIYASKAATRGYYVAISSLAMVFVSHAQHKANLLSEIFDEVEGSVRPLARSIEQNQKAWVENFFTSRDKI